MTVSAEHPRAPDFFIVGHPKCGTTALYEMLRCHPEIYMPDLKEPWFLAPELRSRFRAQAQGRRPETLEQYLALFAPARAEQRAGEASPSYLMSSTAAARIAELQPAARIIAILREPARFLCSFHMQCVRNHIESETNFARALALEPIRRAGEQLPRYCARPHELLYSDHVRYVEQLRRYRELFGGERVLVLIYEDFRADNQATVRRVLRFLGVDDTAPVEAVETNPSVRVRHRRLHDFVNELSLGRSPFVRPAKHAIKAITSRQLRHHLMRLTRRRVVYGQTQAPDEGLMLELRVRFKAEVVELSEYLGRDLVGRWGYDGLA